MKDLRHGRAPGSRSRARHSQLHRTITAGVALVVLGGCGGSATTTTTPTPIQVSSPSGAGQAPPPTGGQASRVALFERELDAMQAQGSDGDFVVFTDTAGSSGGACYVQLSGGTSGKPAAYGYLIEASARCPVADAAALATLGYGPPGSGGGGDPNYFQTVQLSAAVTNHNVAMTVDASFVSGFRLPATDTVSVRRSGYQAPSP